MKMHVGGQKFQTDEPKRDVLNWLSSQDKIICAAGVSTRNLPGRWKTCVSVKGAYLENECVRRFWHVYSIKARSTLNHLRISQEVFLKKLDMFFVPVLC
jgi:hypothetical protein